MTKKVIVSRDVTFAEDEVWQWNTAGEMDSKKRYIYVLNEDAEDGVNLETPAVQPEVVAPIATINERPRREHRQPARLQDYEKTQGWSRVKNLPHVVPAPPAAPACRRSEHQLHTNDVAHNNHSTACTLPARLPHTPRALHCCTHHVQHSTSCTTVTAQI
ncbi:hypothetical protein MRB53_003836 [Persea americana]|uniref:Uncharacterized protein n=1 Tax=Persea americana TaxID=3435 RepID=A0ACC2MYT7_PERAE|nr:hypothetical protein MRB53_003836 [Persea americana]